MRAKELLSNPQYDPAGFLSWVTHDVLKCRNDVGICRALEFSAPMISRIRHREIPVGPMFIVRVHEASGVSTREIKRRMFKQ